MLETVAPDRRAVIDDLVMPLRAMVPHGRRAAEGCSQGGAAQLTREWWADRSAMGSGNRFPDDALDGPSSEWVETR